MRTQRLALYLAVTAVTLACGRTAVANGGISIEIYTDRAAFDARLGSAPRVIDFDDIDTSASDPVTFAIKRYKYSHGAEIKGNDGQYVSREFDPASNMPPSSAPNEYAPGPPSDVLGDGGLETDVTFFSGLRPALIAGFGAVFIDADFPGDGPSSLTVFDAEGGELGTTGTISGGDGSQLFRGIVTIDDNTTMPVAAIGRAYLVSGQGWAGNTDNEAVALDDFAFSTPQVPLGLAGEDCDNCIDDDGDGAVDRFDTECIPPAFGMDLGLGDPKGAGKAAAKCQKGTEKAGAKFVASKMKRLQKCLQAVAKCVQEKGGAPDCIAKATAKCDKELGKIADDEAKTASKVVKACAKLTAMQITDGAGLGYGIEVKPCAAYGIFSLDTPADVAACMVADHECRVERLLGVLAPRAFEYLTAVNHDPGTEFPCLGMGADGAGMGLGDTKAGKALGKCDKEIQKAGLAFLKEAFKAEQKCGDAAVKCVQQKPDDAKCLPKAEAKCAKTLDKVLDPAKGKIAKLLAKTLKKCTSAQFSLADLAAANGLGFSAAAARCTELGYDISTAVGLLSCLGEDHLCEAVRMGEKQAPRLRQLADILNVEPPESF